jgi:hypothetical protein
MIFLAQEIEAGSHVERMTVLATLMRHVVCGAEEIMAGVQGY